MGAADAAVVVVDAEGNHMTVITPQFEVSNDGTSHKLQAQDQSVSASNQLTDASNNELDTFLHTVDASNKPFNTSCHTASETSPKKTKIGIGWRPELALAIERCTNIDFIELMAEEFCPNEDLPQPLKSLINRGTEILVHSTSLSLGGSELPCVKRMESAKKLLGKTGASLISDHIAFVRSARHESGHLLPIERSKDMLEIICENIEFAKQFFSTPLALENIATLFEWPHPEWTEAEFLSHILERTDSGLLLDVSNLYANSVNHKFDPIEYLNQLPLERLTYVHIAGGHVRNGVYHDTHTGSIPPGAIAILRELTARTIIPRVMLEIDDQFPREEQLFALLKTIEEIVS